MTTTRAPWAERKVRKVTGQFEDDNGPVYVSPGAVTKLLLAEHRRAVRAVKRQLDLYQRQREVEKDEHRRDLLAGSIFACVDLLESLQRGR